MKILIICLDNIGDLVMTTVLPRALKDRFPNSRITYLVKEYTRDVVSSNPLIDNVMICNPSWLSDSLKKHFTFSQMVHLIKQLRLEKFDISLVVNADWKKALLAYLSGVPERIGVKIKKSGFFLNQTISHENRETKHMVDDNLDLLKVINIQEKRILPEVFSEVGADKHVDIFIKKNVSGQKRIIGIHPFSANSSRSWDISKFAALCDKLIVEKEVSIFLLIRKGDVRGNDILRLVNKQGIYMTQDYNLAQLIAFIKRCSLFVGNDSGPMHIAAGLRVPVVAIFGPSDSLRFGPLGDNNIVVKNDLPCSPCSSSPDCKNIECLKSITVEQVYEAVTKLIEQRS